MAGTNVIPDGNTAIAAEIPFVVDIIARNCCWVHPETFHQLPVWCPWIARGQPLYDTTWRRRYTNTKRTTKEAVEKVEANVQASQALVAALGVASPKPRNWTVCHIWGYDDPAFKKGGRIVQDHRYYSCVANMVWLPTPLKGFTDAVPKIKQMLRTCAFYLCGWTCEDESVANQAQAIRAGPIPDGYPTNWPAPDRPNAFPAGIAQFTPSIREEIHRRKKYLQSMLADSSKTSFPREKVREVLAFWKINLEVPES